MGDEVWFIDVRGEGGARKPDAYERIMEKWIAAKRKPEIILLDQWVAGEELINKLAALHLPVRGTKIKRI